MTYPLAVFAPRIGARSETFVARHLHDLLPGKTVALAETTQWSDGGHWQAPKPCLVLDQLGPLTHWLQRRGLPSYQREVARFFKQQGVQAVLAEYLDSSHAWLALSKQLGLRFVVHAHGYDVSACLRDPGWRKAYLDYQAADHIVTVSRHAKQKLVELGLTERLIHVIPCGVAVPAAPPARMAGEAIKVLAVGRLVAKKGPLLTLEAFRLAQRMVPELTLDLVGTGELAQDAARFIEEAGLGQAVRLHGSQPPAEVHRLMTQADIFAQHSLTPPETGDEEGLPVGILEAMALGLPVVATQHAGIPEAVLENETGYLVAEKDVAAMAERLIHLARHADDRERLGQAGYERVCHHFSWEKERRELLSLLGLA